MRKFIILMLLYSAFVVGEEFYLIGGGTLSCGKWAAAKEDKFEEQQHIFTQWVAGFIGSYNWYRNQQGASLIQQPDVETIDLWLTKYCSNNPTDPTFNAAAALIQHLGGTATTFRWAK